jgi:hypothetical protein
MKATIINSHLLQKIGKVKISKKLLKNRLVEFKHATSNSIIGMHFSYKKKDYKILDIRLVPKKDKFVPCLVVLDLTENEKSGDTLKGSLNVGGNGAFKFVKETEVITENEKA